MPCSYMGCGTTFYGKRDFWPDGSYLTTEWFTLFLIPIMPLRSWRVKPVGVKSQYDVEGVFISAEARREFIVHSKQRPSPKQVAFTYLYVVGTIPYVAVVLFGLEILIPQEETKGAVLCGSLTILFWFCWGLLPLVVRYRARRKTTWK